MKNILPKLMCKIGLHWWCRSDSVYDGKSIKQCFVCANCYKWKLEDE